MLTDATLIAGPTASGKSALAIDIAKQKDGVVVNTDSMQVYDILRLLTARPDADEMAQVPHFLYGHRAPAEPYSTGHWLNDVSKLLPEIADGRHVVFVGGTGLYFRALLGGLSPMPEIDDTIRRYWRLQLNELGPNKLHNILKTHDAEAAESLIPSDGQRIARALEVFEASGKSILHWQRQRGVQLVDIDSIQAMVLEPDRAILHQRIDKRFDQMIELGAIEEVKKILELDLPGSMPAMKAIGVKQLSSFLGGSMPLAEAIEKSKTATRQYAKRQMTWFRNQLDRKWFRKKV